MAENYKKNRAKLIESLLYVHCEYCNTSQAFKFHCHHIVFRSEKPNHEKLHACVNLIILCDSCHSLFHDQKGIRNDLVKQRQLDKLFGTDILDK